MSSYFLGIDNGGTMCKAAVYDNNGIEISSASRKLELITPRAGFTERDMNQLWSVNVEVIKETISKSGIEAGAIKGVSCTGHGKGLYLWGKENKPCYNGIVSTDSRAWVYSENWNKNGTADEVYKKTFQKILACQPVCLLRWLKDNHPEIFNSIKWIFSVKDYIRFRLTDEAYSELTDCSGTNLINLETGNYDIELLKLFELEEIFDALPPVKKSTDICGFVSIEAARLTGLPQGTPVSGGMFDIDACAISMDITNEDNLCVIAGTWGINEYISKEPVSDKNIQMNSIYCIDGYYLIEESSPTSAGNLEWFINTFLENEKTAAQKQHENIYDYCNKIIENIPPEKQSIIFLPYIYGSNYDAKAKSCFIGMDSHHDRSYIIRAVYEGIVFCHMVHIEKLLNKRGKKGVIRLAGGAAKSSVWAQMFADVSGMPVETIGVEELGTLGCAMAASVASGYFKDLKSAAQKMVKIENRYEPDYSLTDIYNVKFSNYKQAASRLESFWDAYVQTNSELEGK